MLFRCPICETEFPGVEHEREHSQTCRNCGRSWSTRDSFRDAVSQIGNRNETIRQICWNEESAQGAAEFGVFAIKLAAVVSRWLTLPAAALLWLFALDEFKNNRIGEGRLVCAVAVVLVGLFCLSFWLNRRIYFLLRGYTTHVPTLIVADSGIFDLCSYKSALYLPWGVIQGYTYTSDIADESLRIDFLDARGNPLQITVTAAAGVSDKPLGAVTDQLNTNCHNRETH